jgi:hypothetical protein
MPCLNRWDMTKYIGYNHNMNMIHSYCPLPRNFLTLDKYLNMHRLTSSQIKLSSAQPHFQQSHLTQMLPG